MRADLVLPGALPALQHPVPTGSILPPAAASPAPQGGSSGPACYSRQKAVNNLPGLETEVNPKDVPCPCSGERMQEVNTTWSF